MLWILIGVVFLAICYLLTLRGRRNHPGWEAFRGARIAHRGLHGDGTPENSMKAFYRAKERGYGIELDVHLMADGNLAVIHDSLLLRTTGAAGRIEERTTAELENYRLEETEEKIPLFSQVLEMVDGKVPLIIELKSEQNPDRLTDGVMSALEGYAGAYCIESFDPRVVRHLRKHYPQVIRGQLSRNFFASEGKMPWLHRWIITAHILNFLTLPDFTAYRFCDRKRPGTFLVRKFWGIRAVAWTLRTPEELAAAEAEGWLPIFESFTP